MDDSSSLLPCPEDSRDAARYPDVGEALKSSHKPLRRPVAPIETADDYPHVVVLDGKTRVIAADIQWIIQRRTNGGRYPWKNQYYCRSKEGLLLYAPKPIAPELLALPDWFPKVAA